MTRGPIQLGVHIGQQNTPMAELLQLAERLDHNMDWISIWDHLYEAPPNGGDTDHFEAVAALGALAAVTSKVRLGCLMFCMPFRNPALLAKACVAIDHISGGRFEPGFGAGWSEEEFVAHGYDFPSLGTRFEMLTDGMEIITAMLNGEDRVSYTGSHSRVTDVTCRPGPYDGPIPLWTGGNGPKKTPAIAAKYCAGWNVPYVSAAKYRKLNDRIDAACEAIDRDPSTLERSINLAFHIGTDAKSAAAERQRILDMWGPEMSERITSGALIGTPDEAMQQIAAYRDAGADLVNVALRFPVDNEALDAYLEVVVPQLRAG